MDSTEETWRRQQQADHDAVLARCDEALNDASEDALVEAVESATDGFRSVVDNADGGRLLRAYGNRLVRFAQFPDLSEPIFSLFEELALPRFRLHPSGADHWARYVSPFMSNACQDELIALLADEDHNLHGWTNMWAVIALGRSQSLSGSAMDRMRILFRDEAEPSYLRGWAAVVYARHGGNSERREIVDKFLVGSQSMWLRRAGVVAAQELPVVTRAGLFENSVRQDFELSLLWSYLEQHIQYDWFVRSERAYRRPSEPISPMESYEAVGTVGGEVRTFRAYSQFENYDD
ncbi:MAG TPA: hypothetical protein VFB82_05255 [Blastocatellia bacterium]|nr:hypothetical protein [Blastocatellia bacterium]